MVVSPSLHFGPSKSTLEYFPTWCSYGFIGFFEMLPKYIDYLFSNDLCGGNHINLHLLCWWNMHLLSSTMYIGMKEFCVLVYTLKPPHSSHLPHTSNQLVWFTGSINYTKRVILLFLLPIFLPMCMYLYKSASAFF